MPNDVEKRPGSIPKQLSPSQVSSYISFDGNAERNKKDSSQGQLQSEGVAALWMLLKKKRHAYLGDEVGMGKTRQAMGIIATQFLSNPDSHVVIVCPGKPLQEQWVKEWETFITTCYTPIDNLLKNSFTHQPVYSLDLHERLRDFSHSLLLNESRIHLLRYSSFSRPIWFGREKNKKETPEDIFKVYNKCLREIGLPEPSDKEKNILKKYLEKPQEDWRKDMTRKLNRAYAKRIGLLLNGRDIDLVIFDEAQYLRHTGNQQNRNIANVFRGNVKKWLFLSATPLHTGKNDICSLDVYLCNRENLCNREKVIFDEGSCLDCGNDYCTKFTYRMRGKSTNQTDVVELLKEILVRRPRIYVDNDDAKYQKVDYRQYSKDKISSFTDPFTSLTMALVQKRLVVVLEGQNNSFRQGECSSFESLSSSVLRKYGDRDGYKRVEPEFEGGGHKGTSQENDDSPDRDAINKLNLSFHRAMKTCFRQQGLKDNMPHAKLIYTANRVFSECLHNGKNTKKLIFTRRLDTVDELISLLLTRFQDDVDSRLNFWLTYLNSEDVNLREKIWAKNTFWKHQPEKEENKNSTSDDDIQPEKDDESYIQGRAAGLPYFQAIKKPDKGKSGQGILFYFRNRLLRAATKKDLQSNPMKGFLLFSPENVFLAENTQLNNYWEKFVGLLFDTDAPDWCLFKPKKSPEEKWKIATLQRCIMQSFRQTDFLLDLYVLNRFFRAEKPLAKNLSLPEKLIWFLGENRKHIFHTDLEKYIQNWKEKLRRWFVHFDLIVDKCLRGENTHSWHDIYNKVDSTFARMSPAFGRSGRLRDNNAVSQFKFPTHPNVLVCTDVLKEGVDMHLFCDEVVHYGVAWTSGDLEQRIGRVDRFGSLFGRKINRFSRNSMDDFYPRLKVSFPFLEGTLDKIQVDRVFREKMRSDYRLDLGKNEDELGMISIDDSTGSSQVTTSMSIQEGGTKNFEFYPAGVPKGLVRKQKPLSNDDLRDSQLGEFKKNLETHFPECRVTYLPLFDIFVVREPVDCIKNEGFFRLSNEKTKQKFHEEITLEYLVCNGLSLVSISNDHNLRGKPRSGQHFAIVKGFNFNIKWNTLVREIELHDPFNSESVNRHQTVLLERLGSFWFLRTPIFRVEEDIYEGGSFSWKNWIAKENTLRKWGYLIKDWEIIWFVVFVENAENLTNSNWLMRIAERVGRTGDRIQHLYSAADDPEWNYKSSLSFLDISDIDATGRKVLQHGSGAVMKVKQKDMVQYGNLVANLQDWFVATFTKVASSLYESKEEAQEMLDLAPVVMLPGGIFHLKTEGAGRFRLQAFLQLRQENSADANIVFPVPRIIWELGASPNLIGKKPVIDMSDWSCLPHNSIELWEKISHQRDREQFSMYAYKGDIYRYLTFYMSPTSFDSFERNILFAWQSVLSKIQGKNFMKEESRKLFAEVFLM